MKRASIVLAATLAGAVDALAHHSPESHYLVSESITVEGVVTEFRLINPHARIYFNVTTPDGEVQAWMAEGSASAIQRRRGWTKDSIKVGEFIKVSGFPARDGGHTVDWQSIILPDGTELRGGNAVGTERARQIEELDQRRRHHTDGP